jgi:hypothetical protein
MYRYAVRASAILLSAALLGMLILTGCYRTALPHPPSWRGVLAKSVGPAAIRECDTNRDGVISGSELDKHPGLKAAISRMSAGNKGEITAEMVAERVKSWNDSKVARMWFKCRVTHNGKPLEGAVVKLVPEAFLGPHIEVATGKSDKDGFAKVSVATTGPRDPPGVGPGFYRVEISKTGEKIPPKYNAETILGQEIATDAVKTGETTNFDLAY